MDLYDLSTMRIYLDNKALGNVVKMHLHASESTFPHVKVTLLRRLPADGLFNAGIKEVEVECFLENWRDQVVRLRSGIEQAPLSEGEDSEGRLPADDEVEGMQGEDELDGAGDAP